MNPKDMAILEDLVLHKRTWTESAKTAEKDGAVTVAEFCRNNAKIAARNIVDFISEVMKGSAK